jgi:hypothetical protein
MDVSAPAVDPLDPLRAPDGGDRCYQQEADLWAGTERTRCECQASALMRLIEPIKN